MTTRVDRRVGAVVAVVTLGAAYAGLSAGRLVRAQSCGNAIACENQLPGNPDTEWDISGAGDPTIQGFATEISVNQGDTVRFKINTPASAYRLDIYRMGYYAGNGARFIATIGPAVPLPQTQPACLSDANTGLIDCGNWTQSASWQVPTNATSGIFFAKLTRTDTGGTSHIFFIVRSDVSRSDLLFKTADTTWQAYNNYGGNSLYQGLPSNRAYKVSYNRPFANRDTGGGPKESWVFNAEYPMVRWLEANGYDVSYMAGIDVERRSALLTNHKVLLSVGHDEYWSAAQRANVVAARNAGVHLAFFSGNEVFWKTRWENSLDTSNTPNRTLVCYKETIAGGAIDPADPPTWTGTWRDPRFSPPADGGRPENSLSGTMYTVNGPRGDSILVPSVYGRFRFWRNTSMATLASGTSGTLPQGVLGYEWDSDLDNGARPAGLMDLSSTTLSVGTLLLDYGATYGSGTATHNLTLYRHPSGALVFAAGTVQWAWGLDASHDITYFVGNPADVNMQQATVNLFADMRVQPVALQPGLVAASASTDTVAPTSTITSPTSTTPAAVGSPLTISGTAADTGGGRVAGVEVLTDTGWHHATGFENWSYVWTPATSNYVTLQSRAVDDSGNIESPGPGVTVYVQPVQTPPVISAVQATAIGPSTAVITWSTDKAADSQVQYGTTTAYGTLTAVDPTLVASHSVGLSGLTPSTTYHYRVRSKDTAGDLAISGDFTFTTTAPRTTPPVLTSIQATVMPTQAVITWTSDEPANSQVEYGTTTAYGTLTPLDPAQVVSHSVPLGGLAMGTTYHYRVRSTDGSGNLAISSDFTFRTAAQVITFDNLPAPNPLDGQYPSGVIDWGTNVWWISGPWGAFTTNSISFSDGSTFSGSLAFLVPQRLLTVDAYNGDTAASMVTIACSGQPTTQVTLAAGQVATIATGWTSTCSPVTMTVSNGWWTNFTNLAIDVPN